MSDREPSVTRVDAPSGLRERSILRNVYLWMTGGLALTGIVALGVTSSPDLMRAIVSNLALFIGLMVAEVALVWFLSARVLRMSPAAAAASFVVYAVLNGVTLSIVFLAYTRSHIATAFFVSAGTFAGMSLFALTTKRDLSRWGTYLIYGLWGIILATVVNLLLKSPVVEWVVSFVGVALFIGLTAYDTQVIRKWSEQAGDQVAEADYIRLSILGALKLYLDFINLFLFILRIFGRRR